MNIFKTIFKNKTLTVNTSSLFLINAINFLLSLLLLPKLVSIFGVSKWGEIIISQILINYFIWIIDWSFPQYACNQISIYEYQPIQRGSIFVNTRTAQLLLFLLSAIIIIIYSFLISKNQLVYIYSLLTLLGTYLQSYWYLNGREKIYETAFFQLINKLLFTIFVFKSLNKGDNIELYFLYFGLATFITGILSSIRIITKYGEKLKLGNIKSSIELIKKSYILFNSSIIGNITNSSIPFMIGYFSSLENVGIYNIADRIKNILIQIINPLSNSIFPRMSKIYKENKTNANRIFINFLFFISGLGVFLLLLLNLNIDFVINYFLKEKIQGIKTIIRLLSFSFLLNILYESFINQYLIINHLHKDINKIKLYLLSSSILIGIPLIFLQGIYGAALTNLIYESLGLIFVINIFNKTKNKKNLSY